MMTTTTIVSAAHRRFQGISDWSPPIQREIMQIFEGTNQIQRMVISRSLATG